MGNSVFVPNSQEVKDLLPDGIEGITYKNCMPDFSIVAVGEVEIENMSYKDRDNTASGNFNKADLKLAEDWGCTKSQIRKWRIDNGYTWHELNDGKTMQLVPTKINSTFKHLGGCSECKTG